MSRVKNSQPRTRICSHREEKALTLPALKCCLSTCGTVCKFGMKKRKSNAKKKKKSFTFSSYHSPPDADRRAHIHLEDSVFNGDRAAKWSSSCLENRARSAPLYLRGREGGGEGLRVGGGGYARRLGWTLRPVGGGGRGGEPLVLFPPRLENKSTGGRNVYSVRTVCLRVIPEQ